jgi:perosamine synthetase
MLSYGDYCEAFEEEVRRRYHVDYAFVAPNATVALDVLVKTINPRVIYSPAFTWKSLSTLFLGRQVMWLDINKRTWLPIVPEIGIPRDTMVMYNMTFGNVGTVERIGNYVLVYDAAQAFGAEIKDFGDATVFGFAPTKPVTCGEGGMIVTNNSKIAELLEQQRHILLRMSEFNVAVGLTYLNKLTEVQEERRKIWQYYNKNLPFEHQEVPFSHSMSVYGILVSEREKLIEKIKDKMEYRVYYEPLARGLKGTDWVFERILCIPSYAGCPYKQVVEILT